MSGIKCRLIFYFSSSEWLECLIINQWQLLFYLHHTHIKTLLIYLRWIGKSVKCLKLQWMLLWISHQQMVTIQFVLSVSKWFSRLNTHFLQCPDLQKKTREKIKIKRTSWWVEHTLWGKHTLQSKLSLGPGSIWVSETNDLTMSNPQRLSLAAGPLLESSCPCPLTLTTPPSSTDLNYFPKQFVHLKQQQSIHKEQDHKRCSEEVGVGVETEKSHRCSVLDPT